MGQKVNPNILRLGVNKTWKTKFFEKKQQELPLYTFKDIEIKEYIERYLMLQGLLLHDYKQHYTNSTLNLYLSYFVTSDFTSKKVDLPQITLISTAGLKKPAKIAKANSKKFRSIKRKSNPVGEVSASNFYKIQNYLKLNDQNRLKNSSLFDIKRFNTSNNTSYQVTNIKTETVFKELFNVLNMFTNNKFDIVINFCCINKDLNFLKSSQIKRLSSLQKYRNAPFLREGFELLFHVVYNRNSAHLLATFIAIQIRKIKRQKFFTSFLKQALSVLMESQLSTVKGVKILIKGRLNGVPRAKHKMIAVGDVPVQSIKETLDFAQKTVHNSNGSYGVKVWIVEK